MDHGSRDPNTKEKTSALLQAKDLVGFGKVTTEIVRAVSRAIGVVYQPYATRRNADAQAYQIERLAEANAYKRIISKVSDVELERRAVERLKSKIVQEQMNIESTIDGAIDLIEAQRSDVTYSPVEIDADWMSRFIDYAKNISNTEIQRVWSAVPARQAEGSNSVSLRLLDIMKNIGRVEIEAFQNYVFVKKNYGPVFTYSDEFFERHVPLSEELKAKDARLLTKIGLTYHGPILKAISYVDPKRDEPETVVVLQKKFTVKVDWSQPRFDRERISGRVIYDLRGYNLSSIGKELYGAVQQQMQNVEPLKVHTGALEKYKVRFRKLLELNGLVIVKEEDVEKRL